MQLVPFIQLITEDCWVAISKSIRVEMNSNTDKPSRAPIIAPITSTTTSTVITTVMTEVNEQLIDSTSSTTSFTHQRQSQTIPNQLLLSYSNPDQINYFVNYKLLAHIQRIVDERDSYLESIIELEQDKDYLKYQLSTQTQANVEAPTNLEPNNTEIDFKSMSMNDLIANLINNSSAICKIEYLASNTNIELNESNMALIALIDSIYKEIGVSDKLAAGLASVVSSNPSEKDKQAALHAFNDFKSKKMTASGWNQKIAIELVECKLKLRQLVNEM